MLKKSRPTTTGEVKVTFALPTDAADAVSVVGDFNDWDPHVHPMRKRGNGTRSVAVTLPADTEARFLYLDGEGEWHTEPDADRQEENEHGGVNSVLVL